MEKISKAIKKADKVLSALVDRATKVAGLIGKILEILDKIQ